MTTPAPYDLLRDLEDSKRKPTADELDLLHAERERLTKLSERYRVVLKKNGRRGFVGL